MSEFEKIAEALDGRRQRDPNGIYVVVSRQTIEEAQTALTKAAALQRRFDAMLPLFEEARDALPAISLLSAQLRGVRLDLADRMDDVGIAERWKAIDEARPQ